MPSQKEQVSVAKVKLDPNSVRRDTAKLTAQMQFISTQLLDTLADLTDDTEELRRDDSAARSK